MIYCPWIFSFKNTMNSIAIFNWFFCAMSVFCDLTFWCQQSRRKCVLLDVPRFCKYRFRLGESDDTWYYISQLARNRVSVSSSLLRKKTLFILRSSSSKVAPHGPIFQHVCHLALKTSSTIPSNKLILTVLWLWSNSWFLNAGCTSWNFVIREMMLPVALRITRETGPCEATFMIVCVRFSDTACSHLLPFAYPL